MHPKYRGGHNDLVCIKYNVIYKPFVGFFLCANAYKWDNVCDKWARVKLNKNVYCIESFAWCKQIQENHKGHSARMENSWTKFESMHIPFTKSKLRVLNVDTPAL